MNRAKHVRRGLVAALAAAFALATLGAEAALGTPSPGSSPVGVAGDSVPVFAYFYQWFNPSSWDRAKIDFPLIGQYSSDDPRVLRTQVREARHAGINGFLTSWKDTVSLDRRLNLLIDVARQQHLQLGVVYEALDFARRPLPIATVKADLLHLVTRWGPGLGSNSFGRPLIIWTGTDQYSLADVRQVRSALGHRALLLASEKNVADYEQIASLVDGDAYYWSSADPNSSFTAPKLVEMGAAVHAHHGIWIAPATSGFNGRPLGHTRVVSRDGGVTLQRSLAEAFASKPDAVGVISWNEWSENTYIEPGEKYGSQELNVLRTYLEQRRGISSGHRTQPRAVRNGTPILNWSGLQAAIALALITCIGIALLTFRAQRRRDAGQRTMFRSGGKPWVRRTQ